MFFCNETHSGKAVRVQDENKMGEARPLSRNIVPSRTYLVSEVMHNVTHLLIYPISKQFIFFVS